MENISRKSEQCSQIFALVCLTWICILLIYNFRTGNEMRKLMGRSSFIAVTGAQGVGKTTFCRRLVDELRNRNFSDIALKTGLGDGVREKGLPVGAQATTQTIFAILSEHLRRERLSSGSIVVMDRCIVDAIAYIRTLDILSREQEEFVDEVGFIVSSRISLVIELQVSPSFSATAAMHETPQMRIDVAQRIPLIIAELDLPSVSLDASHPSAIDVAISEIVMRLEVSS